MELTNYDGQFEDHLSICIDGSKDQCHVAAAAVCARLKFGVCIPDQISIFTVEAQELMSHIGVH